MSRMYSVVFEEVAVSVVQDLFEIVAPSDSSVFVHALVIGQSSDAGDAESEQLSIICHRGTTSGSGGTTPTPAPMDVQDIVFGGTAEVNNTTQATEGAILHADCFNVMNGYQYVWTPETRPQLKAAGRFVVELQTAPTDALTMSGTLYFEDV